MNEQEEYVEKTKRLLKSYNALRVTLANQEARIQLKKYELGLGEAAPISKYGDAPRGGSQELNAVEKAAARRITIEETIWRLQAEAQKTRYAIARSRRTSRRSCGSTISIASTGGASARAATIPSAGHGREGTRPSSASPG